MAIEMQSKNNIESLLDEGLKHHTSGELDEAEVLYLQVLEQDPKNASCLHFLGIVFAQRNEIEKAVTYFEQAILIKPDNANFHNNIANAYATLNQFEFAKHHYDEAIRLNPESVEAFNNLGNLYSMQNKHDEAIKSYAKAVNFRPDFVDAHFHLGLAFFKTEKLNEAIKQFNNVLQLQPESLKANLHLANVYLLQENLEKAKQFYNNVLNLQPEHSEALNNLGALSAKENDFVSAADFFGRAVNQNEHYHEARSNLATVFLELAKYENALRHLEILKDALPDDLEVTYSLAVAYMAMAKLEEAGNSFDDILKEDPKHVASLANKGAIAMKQHKRDEAIFYHKKILAIEPDNLSSQFVLSSLEGRQDQMKSPDEYVKNLFNGYADYFDAHLVQGLDYHVPDELFNVVSELKLSDLNIFDLGCGTGLVAEKLKFRSSHLVGVDLSHKMIRLAQRKEIYDEVFVGSIEEKLALYRDEFDLIVAGDVFVYYGDLATVFTLCHQAMKNNGHFIFTTEISEKSDFELHATGRFSHSKEYIQKIAKANGFELVSCNVINTRKQNKQQEKGFCFCLRKI